MAYIDRLIENGTNFRVERKSDSVSFHPVGSSDADVDAFQSVVRDLEENEVDSYSIQLTHPVSDRGRNLIDLVLVTLNPD